MHPYTQELDDSLEELRASRDVLQELLVACMGDVDEIDIPTIADKTETACRKLRKAFQKFTSNWNEVRDETEERKDRFTGLIDDVVLLFDQLMTYSDSKALRNHYESATGRSAMIDALINGRTEEYRALLRERILAAAAANKADEAAGDAA